VDVTPEQRTYARLAGIMYLLNYGLQTVWDGLTLWGRGSASFAETARWAVEPDVLYRVALVHVAVAWMQSASWRSRFGGLAARSTTSKQPG
jgi:hypothetical protein